MKRIMFFCLCTLINLTLYAQNHIVNYKPGSVYDMYRGKISSALTELKGIKSRTISIQGVNNGSVDDSADFFIYPLRRIEIMFKNKDDHQPVITCREPESLIVIQRAKKQVYEFTINSNAIARGMNGRFISNYLNLSNLSKTNQLSFFYYLNADRYRRNGAIVQVQNNKFIFNDGQHEYDQIRDYLISECGSIENYIKAFENEKLLLTLKSDAFKNFNPSKEEDVKGFIKNDWRFHVMCFPKDTIANIAAIVNDIYQSEHISTNQKNRIQTELEQILKGKRLKTAALADTSSEKNLLAKFSQVTSGQKSTAFVPSDPYSQIVFMAVDVKPLLYSVLSNAKATDYFNHYLMEQFKFRQVDLHVSALVSKQKYLSGEAKTKIYNDYILSAIQGK